MRPETLEITDVELLAAIARGDEAALGTLYDRYHTILFGLLVRILNNRAEAEDVLQEVFLQVWQRAWDFDATRGKPFTWLVTLTRSRAIDRLRAVGSRERTVQAAFSESPAAVSDAVEDVINAELRTTVREALAELSEDQREALLMAYFQGFSQSEIAQKLKTPLGTIKTRMRLGLIKLRGLLKLPRRD